MVLDPFSGRGTTAFQALLMGRKAVACDVNDVAYCVTKAKTGAPLHSSIRRRISQLEKKFDGRSFRHEAEKCSEFFQYAFAPRTLQQLLYLRKSLKWRTGSVDAMVASLVLGSLHGEMDKSSAYLSNQMPRTISTKPAYSVRYWKERQLEAPDRDVFELLRRRATFRYRSEPPKGKALILQRDMRDLPWIRAELPKTIRLAITSPPYLDVTNFEEDQWLRLWFLGGPAHPTVNRLSRDDRHTTAGRYWQFIADMWRSLGGVLSTKANVVIRMGSPRLGPEHLEQALTAASRFSGRKIDLISAEVSKLKNRQTDSFRLGTKGISVEVDCHYRFAD